MDDGIRGLRLQWWGSISFEGCLNMVVVFLDFHVSIDFLFLCSKHVLLIAGSSSKTPTTASSSAIS